MNQFKSVALEKEKSKMINNDLMIEDITDAQALLEEKIIECFSEDGSELNMRISALIIHYILGEWENDYVSNEARINLKEIDNVYHKFLANDFTLEEPLSLDLSVKQKEYCVVVRPFFRYVVSILEEIEIEKYDISYNEFLNALDNATNILYM